MSITHLETHQTSSQQIKIMAHITPGEIIVFTNKSQFHEQTLPTQHLPKEITYLQHTTTQQKRKKPV